ncbi:hypothetical protein MPSEU_000596500 [Mayamaea pseudoterrestris]|nr:hypothetical protein MPSEU_000596500 [Mayamaea pseudoterrestris]
MPLAASSSRQLAMIVIGGALVWRRAFAFVPYHHGRKFGMSRTLRFMTASTSASDTSNSNDENNSDITWSTDKVRSTFINYFQDSHHHVFQPSSACAPLNDPTLLFTNAGMNQFKPIFLGQVDPQSPLARLKRVVNAQKCIRAGGKHNDLEDVGRDTYHHTFFEMLGTWSFDDYFKEKAIDMAWDLLVNVYKLDPERIYATYFNGNDQVDEDVDARNCWLKYLPESRVIACDARDNFWEMGDTGPCGPCSEIHYDRRSIDDSSGERPDARHLVNADDPNVIEIWNIVFIQYNRDEKGLQLLPAKHIDTGMGLERLVSILQLKTSNYDIDVFQPIFAQLAKHSKIGAYEGRVGQDDVDLKDTAYRAIADHVRTLSFAIADGAVPNNEGRGYVLRRILRRATRYGQQILKAEPGFFATLVPVVVETFGEFYPELKAAQSTITEIIQEEEQAFSSMLERGIKYFDDMQHELQESGETVVSGSRAFYLYDTLGFPIDLTELMAQEAGMSLDVKGFETEMEQQKNRSRQAQKAARAGGAPALELIAEQTAWLADNDVEPTDDSFKYKWDVELPATVMAIFSEDGFLEDGAEAREGDFVGVILDKSSYYAESGGQVADTGIVEIWNDSKTVSGKFNVKDSQVYAGFILHKGVIEGGSLRVGQAVNCKVDYERRRLIAPNHSMTHVLNAALRQVLGADCDQRGSLCNEEKLRFDFSYKKALTPAQLKAVEDYCQNVVKKKQVVISQVMPLDEAKQINGVRAVFGEVYPDPVKVVTVGDETSVEFCGGTHLSNTAEAEAFVLVEETAVAKGIRRISAVTKGAAKQAIAEGQRFVELVNELEKIPATTSDLDKKAGAVRKDLDAAFVATTIKAELRGKIEGIQKNASEAKKKEMQQRVDLCLNDVRREVEAANAAGKKSLVLNVDIGADSKASQRVTNTIKELAPDLAFFGLSEEEVGSGGKVLAFACVPDELVDVGFKADEWVRVALEACGGRGGGRPNNAQGQAQECQSIESVIETATSFAESKVQAIA